MFFQNWRKTIAFLSVLFLALLLLSWSNLRINQQPLLVFVQSAAREILAPVQSKLEQSLVWLRENIASVQELGTLRDDNRRLKQENDELLELALSMQELLEENKRLRDLMNYKSYNEKYDFLPARIIGWPSNWSSRSLLYAGSSDGLKVDMPAVTPRGVVGRLIQVTPNTSVLMLLQDELSGIGGRVQPSGALGIVRGQGSQDPHLKMYNISLDADIQPGDSVVTSGLGDIFPAGHLIGTVISIENDVSGLHRTATLQMAVDTYSLYEVLIIISETDLEPPQTEQQEPIAP